MKKLTLILLTLTMVIFSSCTKDKSDPKVEDKIEDKIEINYKGETFTTLEYIGLAGGNLTAKGSKPDGTEFLLIVSGVEKANTTTSVCTDDQTCTHMCTVSLTIDNGFDFFGAINGTVKRVSENSVEINVTGVNTDLEGEDIPFSASLTFSEVITF